MIFCSIHLMGFLVLALNLQKIISKPITPHHHHNNSISGIPTPQESAILARRILRLTPVATFSTIFPLESESNSSTEEDSQKVLHAYENRPRGLENVPIGLIDYVADCEVTGNPTILAIDIATTFKNVAAGSNVSLSFSWVPPNPAWSNIFFKHQHIGYPTANLPRFSLFGYLERLDNAEVEDLSIEECFVKTHPDAKDWLPGNDIHSSRWERFVVQQIYWIGGFGDRAFIGWIPVEFWRNVWEEDINRARLPGERSGWKDVINNFLNND